MTILLIAALPLCAVAAFLVYALHELSTRTVNRRFDPSWLDDFSVARYRPMERLLSETDFDFLKTLPGHNRRLTRALRAERRRIFRAYLRSLIQEFNALYFAVKLLATYSGRDRSDLLTELMKQRVIFARELVKVEIRLAFHFLGCGTVQAGSLLAALSHVQAGLAGAPVQAL